MWPLYCDWSLRTAVRKVIATTSDVCIILQFMVWDKNISLWVYVVFRIFSVGRLIWKGIHWLILASV